MFALSRAFFTSVFDTGVKSLLRSFLDTTKSSGMVSVDIGLSGNRIHRRQSHFDWKSELPSISGRAFVCVRVWRFIVVQTILLFISSRFFFQCLSFAFLTDFSRVNFKLSNILEFSCVLLYINLFLARLTLAVSYSRLGDHHAANFDRILVFGTVFSRHSFKQLYSVSTAITVSDLPLISLI
jgi:hypothetical protein